MAKTILNFHFDYLKLRLRYCNSRHQMIICCSLKASSFQFENLGCYQNQTLLVTLIVNLKSRPFFLPPDQLVRGDGEKLPKEQWIWGFSFFPNVNRKNNSNLCQIVKKQLSKCRQAVNYHQNIAYLFLQRQQ